MRFVATLEAEPQASPLPPLGIPFHSFPSVSNKTQVEIASRG
jgi:hypothetical protein